MTLRNSIKRLTVLISVVLMVNGCAGRYNGPNPEVVHRFELESDSLLLIVKVKDTERTDYYPENVTKICYGEGNCHPWAYWYVYEGEVLEVVKGEFDERLIKFAMLNHADYYKGIKKEWYVVLKEFKDQDAIEKLSTKYFVENHSSEYSINH